MKLPHKTTLEFTVAKRRAAKEFQLINILEKEAYLQILSTVSRGRTKTVSNIAKLVNIVPPICHDKLGRLEKFGLVESIPYTTIQHYTSKLIDSTYKFEKETGIHTLGLRLSYFDLIDVLFSISPAGTGYKIEYYCGEQYHERFCRK